MVRSPAATAAASRRATGRRLLRIRWTLCRYRHNVHLLRNSFKYASRRDWAEIAKDLKPVYTAASEAEAFDLFAEFSGKWEKRYPAIIRLQENACAEFVRSEEHTSE